MFHNHIKGSQQSSCGLSFIAGSWLCTTKSCKSMWLPAEDWVDLFQHTQKGKEESFFCMCPWRVTKSCSEWSRNNSKSTSGMHVVSHNPMGPRNPQVEHWYWKQQAQKSRAIQKPIWDTSCAYTYTATAHQHPQLGQWTSSSKAEGMDPENFWQVQIVYQSRCIQHDQRTKQNRAW